MNILQLSEVEAYTDELASKLDSCKNGEGDSCTRIDIVLTCTAKIARDFWEQLRAWRRAVFSGQVSFDPETEKLWISTGNRIRIKLKEILAHGRSLEVPCYSLPGLSELEATIYRLNEALDKWTKPKLAISPFARRAIKLAPEQIAEAKAKLAILPPLSIGAIPSDS